MALPPADAPSCCSGTAAESSTDILRTEAALRARLAADPPLATDEILLLLAEPHPLYDGLGSPAVVRIRGALIRALPRPLPAAAVPYVLEELESAHDAYLTAVAAHVLRSGWAPDAALARPLISALSFVRSRDEPLRLGTYGGYGDEGEPTTAVEELLATLAWLGAHGVTVLDDLRAFRAESPGPARSAATDAAIAAIEAGTAPKSCCGTTTAPPAPRSADPVDIAGVEFEDQAGAVVRFGEFFAGKPTVVAFFYTRCANPAKCPLTITKLGRLQALLAERGLDADVRTAAITYDPAFDSPPRLEQYGRSFGMRTGENHRLLRTTGDFAPVKAWFELGVGYAGPVVNRHQLEVFVLGADGRIDAAITRRAWTEHELLERVHALL